MYYRARYYAQGLGRFISADTMVPQGENPQAWNRYSYTANNPLKYIDPSGHCWGIFSFLRDWPIYSSICPATDQSWRLVTDGNVSFGERLAGSAYLVTAGISHAALALGSAGVVCGSVTPCATAVEGALGIGGPATMICMSGNCEKIAEVTIKSAEGLSHLGGSIGQTSDTGCGPACVEMMLQDLGVSVPQEVISDKFGEPMDPGALARALNSYSPEGMNWVGGGLEGIDPLAAVNYLNSRGPWVAQLMQQGWSMGHWVVVDGMNVAGNMVVRDPSGVLTELPLQAFLQLWNKMIVVTQQ